jgi:glucose/arabinose dehydrogenase
VVGGDIGEPVLDLAVNFFDERGLLGIALHPDFESNGYVYLYWTASGEGEGDDGLLGPDTDDEFTLPDLGNRVDRFTWDGEQLTWDMNLVQLRSNTLDTDTSGRIRGNHDAGPIVFGQDGKLFIINGDQNLRGQYQNLTDGPAPDDMNFTGVILRLNDDGSVPPDNPFSAMGDVSAQIWSLGHRNPLGLAFDPSGQLWELEMGPAGGDELNRIERGANYGWPRVSEGKHYDGREIPPHSSNPAYKAPAISWTPVIAPGDFIIYTGKQFPAWKGEALVAGMKAEALIRVKLEGAKAREVARYPMGQRIREIDQANDGALLLLEDGAGARLLKLTGAAAK